MSILYTTLQQCQCFVSVSFRMICERLYRRNEPSLYVEIDATWFKVEVLLYRTALSRSRHAKRIIFINIRIKEIYWSVDCTVYAVGRASGLHIAVLQAGCHCVVHCTSTLGNCWTENDVSWWVLCSHSIYRLARYTHDRSFSRDKSKALSWSANPEGRVLLVWVQRGPAARFVCDIIMIFSG